MVKQTFDLNMIPGKPKPVIHVSQYDNLLRGLEIHLYAGTEPYETSATSSFTIQGTKADYTGFSYTNISGEGNVITFDVTEQMTAFPGAVECEVVDGDSARVASGNFILMVEPAALKDDTIISETDIPIIQRLPAVMDEMQDAIETLDQTVQQVSTDAQTASTAAANAQSYARTASDAANGAYQSANRAEEAAMSVDGDKIWDAINGTDGISGYYTTAAFLISDTTWEALGSTTFIPVESGDRVKIKASSIATIYALVTAIPSSTGAVAFVSGETAHALAFGAEAEFTVGTDCFLSILTKRNPNLDATPALVEINGVNLSYNLRQEIDSKQDTLTFDTTPTEGSSNPVTSGGIYTAVETATAEARETALKAFATPTASGSLLTLTDGADGIPAKKLTLNLPPHQSGSGDPSPDNVRSISGYTAVKVTRTGKNLLENVMADGESYGVTYVRNADGSITANGTSTNTNVKIISAMQVRLPKGTYILTGGDPTIGLRCNRYNASGEIIDRITNASGPARINVDDTVDFLRFFVFAVSVGTTVNSYMVYPLLRAASFADDTYKPYTGEEYDITIPTAAGTVYGGNLEINEDGSGTLTVDRAMITSYAGESLPGVWISDRDVYTHGTMPTNGAQVVYVVATPTTYTITADQVTTLLGDNTVWMDADGSIDLTYRADTQKYIDSRIALLNSNLAYIEDGMTASRTYTVGQYVLIGGQLYKVTASIASGATFTIGTNVVATTVGTELTALNN